MDWKLIVGVLTSPMRTLEKIAEDRPVLPAAWIIIISCWCWCFGVRLAYHNGAERLAEFLSNYSAPHALLFGTVFHVRVFFLFLLSPLLAIVFWFLRVAVLQLSAEILGGTGRGFSFLATFGFAHIPMILLLPVAMLSSGLGGGDLSSGAGATIWYTLAIVIHLWTLYAVLLSIRATHRLNLIDAVRVVAYPVIALVVVVGLLTVFVHLSGLTFSELVKVGQGRQDY